MALRAVVVVLLSLAMVAKAAEPMSHLDRRAFSLIGQAERFIRSLNLLPSLANHASDSAQPHGHSSAALFEKSFHLPVRGDSGSSISGEEFGHHAGYFELDGTHAARMFYMFFESRGNKAEDPVVLWMSGGPGCSSELALFYENGPFQITDNLTLTWNEHGWDKASSIIFVDQPVGTGFSYSSDIRDMRHDEKGVSEDMYHFLQAFFKAHPNFINNDFFVTGESYAGHYVPAVTSRIHKANKANEGLQISLKGFAIGNGLTNPEIQYKAYADYAVEMGLIKETSRDQIRKMYPTCEKAIKLCGDKGTFSCAGAYMICNSIFSSIMAEVGNINYYDIRSKCSGSLCYDFSNMEKFLNQQVVREALGVGDRKFVSCSPLVYKFMIMDWMRNLEVGIPALLEDGIQLLVYAGEYDLICNWLGNSRWVSAIDWSGKNNYGDAPTKQFLVDGEEAGTFSNYGPLTFLKVHNAGHMVPMDQPRASLEMIKRFTQGVPLEESSYSIIKQVVESR
ncbi:hypothetical protein GOP47_0003475 [Adiantum capillus-veneris]|nr:hypothetical protein GOP47_0003475 [Adiantum capillus-veneris]